MSGDLPLLQYVDRPGLLDLGWGHPHPAMLPVAAWSSASAAALSEHGWSALSYGYEAGPGPLIVCGRFEGVDQRVIGARRLEEVSIGDYVLSGGEIAAMALIDACVRLLPGVMGKQASGADESFSEGLLEYPQFTRPQEFEGVPIPEILTSGDHAKVAAWRRAEAEALTRARRPDLWAIKTSQKAPQKRPKGTTDG